MRRSVKSERTCGDCQFYISRNGCRGDCRRSAPVVIRWNTCWPLVQAATLVCGEFKLRRQIKAIANGQIDWDVFSTRVQTALRRASIESWRQLQQLETDDLLAIPGIGAVAIEEISEVRDARRLKSSGGQAANGK